MPSHPRKALTMAQRAAAVQRAARWSAAHTDEANANKQRYYERNKLLIATRRRERRKANLQASRAKDQQWRDESRELIAGARRRRRAAKNNAPVNDLSPAQWLEIQAAHHHRCYYCHKRCKGKLTQDHLTPLSKGGAHTAPNVIAACRSCNSRKGTRPPPIPVQPFLLTVAPAKKRRAS